MATNGSFTTTKESNEILCGKEQVIEPYMFEPNKGDRCEASDDSSEDSGSEEEEFGEEFEAANAWRRTSHISYILGKKCVEFSLRVFIHASEKNLLPPLVCTLTLSLLNELA